MLLINKTLLRMSKGIRLHIVIIAALKLLVLAGTASFAQTVSSLLGDYSAVAVTPEVLRGAVLSALLAALVILAGEAMVGEVEYLCTARARAALRAHIFEKLLLLDVGNIERVGSTTAVASAVDGVEQMQVYYSKYLPSLLYSFMAPFYLFYRLQRVSLPIASFLLVVSLVILPANNMMRKVIERLKGDYWNSFRSLTGYFLESLQGLTTLILFNRDEHRAGEIRKRADDFNTRIMDVMKVNFKSFLFSDGTIYLSIFIAIVATCRSLMNGTMDLSAALMVLMLGYGFFGSVRLLMSTTHQALSGIAAAQNVADLLEIDVSRPSSPMRRDEAGFSGIRVSGVSFAYQGRPAVLRDVELEFARGKTTALVGRSGCGKSTVAGLLMRFYDPSAGEIAIDGVDYTCYPPDELRKHIAMVPQQVGVFSGTIEENLRIAAPSATEAELWDVLTRCRLADWVRAQPDGLRTDVGDAGGKLSGGQRQKIGIARVLLCGAPILIFDEATSSVDVDSEQEIWDCIDELGRSKTLIIISHRLSTIRGADRIYVLQGGGVNECGNHEALMAQSGLYHSMVTEQRQIERIGAPVGAEEAAT